MADEEGFVFAEDAVIGDSQAGQSSRARHGPDLLGHVLPRVDGDDARSVLGLRRVDTRDAGVRVHRAQERDVERIRQLYIVDVVAEALDQARVFRALHPLSDILVRHKISYPDESLISRRGLSLHLSSGVLDRLDYVLVARTAAEVAFDPVPYLVARRVRVAFEKLGRRNNHAGGAVPALEAVSLPEPLLHGVKLAVAREPLDGGDACPVRLDGKDRAGLDRLAVDQNGAGSADRRFAADMRSGQVECVSEIVDQQ